MRESGLTVRSSFLPLSEVDGSSAVEDIPISIEPYTANSEIHMTESNQKTYEVDQQLLGRTGYNVWTSDSANWENPDDYKINVTMTLRDGDEAEVVLDLDFPKNLKIVADMVKTCLETAIVIGFLNPNNPNM
jgi:hypothetical protein